MTFKCCSTIEMSPMEKIIYNELNRKNIKFYREVSFKKCINPKTGNPLRYDFYIPSKNLLIEYDGKEYHQTVETKERDAIKDKFAKDNKIKLIRLSGKSSIYSLIKKFPHEQPAIKIPKKKKAKKKIKYEEVTELSPTEKYHLGLQPPIVSKHTKSKQNKEKTKNKKEKGSVKESNWKPVPYKRIIII